MNKLFRSKEKSLTHAAAGVVIVHVSADADPKARARFEQVSTTALAGRPKRVIVDLSKVDFVSTVMLGMFLELRRRAMAGGAKVCLADVQPVVRRVLNICKLDLLFTIHSSVESALEDAGANAVAAV